MKKFIIQIVSIIVSLSCLSFCAVGCDNKTSSEIVATYFKEIEETEIKDQLQGFEFVYEYNVPGAEVSYQNIWSNDDSEYRYYYTYLTEYKEEVSDFYLVYLSKNEIAESKDWIRSYEDDTTNYGRYYDNYHFTNFAENRVIDGKYLYGYQSKPQKSDGIKFYRTNDLTQVEYEKDGYQLVLCAQSKKAVIKKNITTSEEIGKEITVYKRVELQFGEDENTSPTYYEFETVEKTNQTQIAETFGYTGEMIECYPRSYENNECGYFPILGFKGKSAEKTKRIEVISKNGQKAVILPRYTSGKDLLDEKTEIFGMDDIYGEERATFKEALITDHENGKDAYFNYEKIIAIIEIIRSEGRFYSLTEAYDKGLLRYEDIQAIADIRSKQEYEGLSDEKLALEIRYAYAKQEREEGYPHSCEGTTIRDFGIKTYYGLYGNCHVVQLSCATLITLDKPYGFKIEDISFMFTHPCFAELLVVYEKIK